MTDRGTAGTFPAWLAEREFFLYALLFHTQIWQSETEALFSVRGPFWVKHLLCEAPVVFAFDMGACRQLSPILAFPSSPLLEHAQRP